MTWTHLKANGGMGLEEQWILRVQNAPVCSLKAIARVKRGRCSWTASLLCTTGISTIALDLDDATLEQAQAAAEAQLRAMGWSWGPRPQSEVAT